MTDNLTEWKGKIAKVTTSVGNQPWHYVGEIKDKGSTHISIDDGKEGLVSVPLVNSLIRTPSDEEIQKYQEYIKKRKVVESYED